jgi:hypothetical protein
MMIVMYSRGSRIPHLFINLALGQPLKGKELHFTFGQ